MIYHLIAINTPFSNGLLTYSHPIALPIGRRVAVSFSRKTVVGIVWQAEITPDIAPEKILPISEVFADEPLLPSSWQRLLEFTARYYHYPLGQSVFTALPQGLKEPKPIHPPKPEPLFSLSESGQSTTPPPERHHKQRQLWQALSETPQPLSILKIQHPQAEKLLTQWQQQGWVQRTTSSPTAFTPSLPEHTLNHEQNTAATHIINALSTFQPFLLHGTTGSGKTEVYFAAIAAVLAQGRQALLLLPEINLTPQLLARVHHRFPNVPTAVLHSQTAAGARTRDYLRALTGQARLVIGTRLAVFTPMPNLGLIVVDEEHDSSFKQDNELRYHARDLAVWRAKDSSCPIVLGSATPSLESWHKAHSQQYQMLTLTQRAHTTAVMPQISILDIRHQPLDQGFSNLALQYLQQNFHQGGLSLVYLNRRGFAPALFCSDCGHTFGCPNCSAKMVLHQRAHQLRCHHCDYRQAIPHRCPECGNHDLTAVGQGTQRVEDTLRQAIPDARIVRVDRDTTSHKNDWTALYEQINNGLVDILVGTQMLAKGHDFGRLNLVVVLNADGSLYSADFRAPERLFAELMQVSGRSGRAQTPGKVLIQTHLPDHAVFHALRNHDFAAFANDENNARSLFSLPPHGFQAAIRADAPDMDTALNWLTQLKTSLQPTLPHNVSIMGPAPMLLARLASRERAQIFLESTDRKALHQAINQWQHAMHHTPLNNLRWSIDIDPQDM